MSETDNYFKAFPAVDAIGRLLYDETIVGLENIPKEGGALLAANHLRKADSFIAPAVIARKLGRKVIFAAKDSYFNGGFTVFGHHYRSPTAVFFQDYTEAIPVDRTGKNPRAIEVFKQNAIDVLNAGNLLEIHIEGSRSLDGKFHKPRSGMANIALATHADIIPTVNEYPDPIGFHLRQPMTLTFLPPITYEEYGEMKPYQISNLVRDRILEVSGQEYVDEYAEILTKEERKKRIRQLKRGGGK